MSGSSPGSNKDLSSWPGSYHQLVNQQLQEIIVDELEQMERELPSQVEESPVSNRRIHYKRHWKAIGNTGQLLHERAVTFIRVAQEGFKIMATRVTGRNNSFMSISKSSLIRRLTNPTAILISAWHNIHLITSQAEDNGTTHRGEFL